MANAVAFVCQHTSGTEKALSSDKPKKIKTVVTYAPGASSVKADAVKGAYDYIAFYGSHGDTKDGGPLKLNGLSTAAVQQLVKDLTKNGVTAKVFVLDCCFSASFVPMLAPLLANGADAAIICHWGSAPGTMIGMIDAKPKLGDVAAEKIKDLSEAFGGGECFISVSAYSHATKTFYRKKYTNLKKSSEDYVDLVAGSGAPTDFDDLPKVDAFLKKSGLTVKETDEGSLKTFLQTKVGTPT